MTYAMREIKEWVLKHKALTALFFVLLTMVPAVKEYEIVDSRGRGIQFYKEQVCQNVRGEHEMVGNAHQYFNSDACDAALEMMFSHQFAFSGRALDKQPLIPGLFHRKKTYTFSGATLTSTTNTAGCILL